jgi:nucleoid-associated protein YgaU
MFVRRAVLTIVLAAVVLGAALSSAHPTSGAAPERRYVVRPGDTLWAIAATRYAGDPREAVWRIRDRNGLESALLRPGQVLVMPP